mgnify:CR=1 FL=1
MTQAIGILELTSIARGMELGDVMLKSANVQLLLCRTLCPGKFLLMLGGDVGAVQQAIAAGTARAGEMLVDSLVLANIHPSVLPAISGLNVVEQRQAAGIVETWSVAACISAADRAVKAANVILVRVHMRLVSAANATWWWRVISPMSTTPSRWPATAQARKDYWFTGQ